MVYEDPLEKIVAVLAQVFNRGPREFRDVLANRNPAASFPDVYSGKLEYLEIGQVVCYTEFSEQDIRGLLNQHGAEPGHELSEIPQYKCSILIAKRLCDYIYGTDQIGTDRIIGIMERVSNIGVMLTDAKKSVMEEDFETEFGVKAEQVRAYSRQGLIEPLMYVQGEWFFSTSDYTRLKTGEVQRDYQTSRGSMLEKIFTTSNLPSDIVIFPAVMGGGCEVRYDDKGRLTMPRRFLDLLPVDGEGKHHCSIAYYGLSGEAYLVPSNLASYVQPAFAESPVVIDRQGRTGAEVRHLFPGVKEVTMQGNGPYITITPIRNNPVE